MPLQIFVNDRFETRTLPSGWGSADVGGAYTLTGATTSSVDPGIGNLVLNSAAQTAVAALTGVNDRSSDFYLRFTLAQAATGTGVNAYVFVRGRVQANGDCYEARLLLHTNPVQLQLFQRVGGTYTQIGTTTNVTGLTFTAGQYLWLRLQLDGPGPTATRVKAWRDAALEPSGWTINTTNNATSLQTSGSTALGLVQSAQATLPQTLKVHDFEMIDANQATAAPAAPRNLQAQNGSPPMLTWLDTSDTHFNYTVRDSGDKSVWSTIAILGRNATQFPPTLGGAYRRYYQVRAVNPSGTANSEIVSAVPPPPQAPAGFTTALVNTTQPLTITLTLPAAASNVHSWQIEEQIGSGAWVAKDLLPASTAETTYTYPSGTYGPISYRLRAVNDGGSSAASAVALITVEPPAGRAVGTTATWLGERRIRVTWSYADTGPATAHLERRLTNGPTSPWTRCASNLVPAQRDVIDTVPSPGVWVYRVVTENSIGIATLGEETDPVTIRKERMHLVIRNDDTAIDLGGDRYSLLLRDGWTPQVAGQRDEQGGNQSPFDEVDETQVFNVIGPEAADNYAAQNEVLALLNTVDRRHPDLLWIEYQPKGSVLPAPLFSRIVARVAGSDLLGSSFGRTGTLREIGGSKLAFRRRGLWTAPAAIASSTETYADVPDVTVADVPDHRTPSPLSLRIGLGTPAELPTAPAASVLIATDPDHIAIVHAGIAGAVAPAWTTPTEAAAAQAYNGTVLRYTPTTTNESTSGKLRLPAAFTQKARRFAVFAAAHVAGSATYLVRLTTTSYGRSSRTDSAVCEPTDEAGATIGRRIVPLGTLVLDPSDAADIQITAQATSTTSTSLSINYLALLALDNDINRDIAVTEERPLGATFPDTGVPLQLAIVHDPLAWRPLVAYTSDEAATAIAVSSDGNAALMHYGTTVATAYLACSADGTTWRPVGAVSGAPIRTSLQAERFSGYLSPE